MALVVHLSHGIQIKGRFPIHKEEVLMVAMGKLHPNDPAAVRHSRHWMGRRLPPIKVTNKSDVLSLRRPAEEVHQVQRFVA